MRKKQSSQSKRQVLREQRMRRQRRQRLTTILIVAGVALGVAALLIYPSVNAALAPVGEIVEITPVPRPQADFNAMGNPDAPVTMIEYSDFQCPFCKRFSDETEAQIVENYVETGQVYFVYVPYGPGGQWIGPESETASRAAYCAGDQEMFWEYKDILFANHTGENVGDYTDKRLMAYAESLGLDMDEFSSCYNSNKYDAKLREGLLEGQRLGLTGTPAFTINGKVVTGALPFSDPTQTTDFQREIEAALAEAGG